jgi:hypothetical protein
MQTVLLPIEAPLASEIEVLEGNQTSDIHDRLMSWITLSRAGAITLRWVDQQTVDLHTDVL